MDYSHDCDWTQWNTTGKIRILMEATAGPPMARYSVDTKKAGSANTTLSSLTSHTSNYDHPPGRPELCPTELGGPSASSSSTHEPNEVSIASIKRTNSQPTISQVCGEKTVEKFQEVVQMNRESGLSFDSVVWNGIAIQRANQKWKENQVGQHTPIHVIMCS